MLWRGGGALKSEAALRVLRHITGIATKRIHPAGVSRSCDCAGPKPSPTDPDVVLPLLSQIKNPLFPEKRFADPS